MTGSSIESKHTQQTRGVSTLTNEEVFDRCGASIERMISTKVSSPADVDDLLQTTFMRFLSKRAQGVEIAEPTAFLRGIAKHVIFEHWRRKARLCSHEEVGECSLQALGVGLSTLLHRGEGEALLVEAMHELKLKVQMVLELYYWEGLTYQEIAETMGIRVGTVGTLMHRGRKDLAAILQRRHQPRRVRPRPDEAARCLPDGKDVTVKRRHPRRPPHASRPGCRLLARVRRRRSVDGDSADTTK